MNMRKKLHILHIEDDEVDAELIRQTLLRSELDCDITLAMSRAEYTQALQGGGIDLILSDNRGYDFDGLEVLRTVRRHYPQIPFLFLSGSFEGKDLELLKGEGACDCLLKSDVEAIVPAIRRALLKSPPATGDVYIQQLEQLVQVIRDLPRARDMEAVIAGVCRAARELCGADCVTFVLREGELCHVAGEDSLTPFWKGRRFQLSESITGWVMQHGVAVIEDSHADPRVPNNIYRGTYVNAMTVLPIALEGDFLGSLGCLWRTRHRPTEGEVKLLGMLADAAAVALQNVRKLADLELRLRDRGRDLEAVTKELEAFSYSVSHDLRGPLRSVSGFGKLLAKDYEDRLDEAGKNFLAYVTDGTLRISVLVDALLELSRVSRMPLEKQPVDLSKLAHEVIAALRQREPERRCEVSIAPGLTAEADPRLARITLENLLGNAWKFSSQRAEASIELGRRHEDGVETFYVRDNGAGFEMAYADKLFTPFQRQHRQDEFEGAGVGLATVQRIVMRHGGRIWAEAVEGEGATFFFTLKDGSRNLQG
jgi:signal transduction histidine kinase/CheY-like chemotaxis protein